MPRRARATYLDLIDRDRQNAARPAAERTRGAPLRVRADYPRARALRRDLARHYEACKGGSAKKRFRGERLDQYCAATAWTIVRKGGRYPDYPHNPQSGKVTTMAGRSRPRDSKGRFLKRGSRRRPKSGSEPRRRARTRRHNVRGYTMQRAGKTVRVRGHRSREASAPRARPRRRRAAARRSSRRRSSPRSTNITIMREMMARSPRRRRGRRYYAKAPPMATAGGLVIAGLGGLVGYEVTDLMDRYIAGYTPGTSPAPTLPAGVADIPTYNDLAVAAKPGMGRIFAGLGSAVFGFVLGAVAPWAGLKMFLYGWGLGATFHVGGQLLNVYVVQPLFSGTNAGSRMFQHETNAQAKLNPATTTTTTSTTSGLGALPGGMVSQRGTPLAAAAPGGRALPMGQPSARIPVSLAARRGGTMGQSSSYDYSAVSGFTPGTEQPLNPPSSQTPPATTPPASPPPSSQPPMQPPPTQTICAPCAPIPGAGMQPICGGVPNCGCPKCTGTPGAMSGSYAGVMGQPPEGGGYAHPLFRNMLIGHTERSWRRRAA